LANREMVGSKIGPISQRPERDTSARSGLADGRAALFPPPALGERCHRSLARRRIAVRRPAVIKQHRPHPWHARGLSLSETYALKYWWCSPPRTGIASM